MQKWLMSVVLGLMLGATATLAQDPPPRDGHRPPPPDRQQLMHQQMMHHQWALQQRCLQAKPACPVHCPARPLLGLVVLAIAVIHILLTVWVYQDLRRRNAGSGVWIVITLLAGLCGAAVYALVRLGDKPS